MLWSDDHLVNNVSSLPRSELCHQSTWWLRHPQESDHRLTIAPMVWVPRYWGPDLVVVTPGVPPLSVCPVLFSPSLAVAQAVASSSPPKLALDKEAMAVLLLAAVVVLPVIDVVFAALRPESDARSADATDEVNAYNDLSRTSGTPCSP